MNADELLNERPSEIYTDPNGLLQQEKSNPQTVLFLLLGNTALLAFNIFINAIDIYIKLVGRDDMGTILNRAYNVPCSIMALILCIFKPSNIKISLTTALSALVVIMCVIPVTILVKMSTTAVYWISIIAIGCTGVFSSLCFSSCFAFASQFGEKSTAAVSSGNGMCGVIASALRIITKAAVTSESSTKFSNAAYFFLTAAIILATLIYFLYMSRKPEISFRLLPAPTAAPTNVFSRNTIEIIKDIYPQWLSVFFNFCITLSLFPGYVTLVKQPSYLGDWTPVIVTTLFTVFDWVGRALPAKGLWPKAKYAWIPIACRLLSYVIFMISIQGAVNLGEPWWTFCWMIPFALSNGYFGTIQMIYGSNVQTQSFEQRQYASFLMSFAVNAGILAAMGLSLAVPSTV